jgi:DNA-binding transcriptional regulator YdaS (Cro superfamily)
MKKLQAYLNGLATSEQAAYARRSGTTIGYLRKAISTGQKIGEGVCINLERESRRAVMVEDLRDDVDWAYLRNSAIAAPDATAALPPGVSRDRRDPTRISPYAGTDIDRRAPAGEGAA